MTAFSCTSHSLFSHPFSGRFGLTLHFKLSCVSEGSAIDSLIIYLSWQVLLTLDVSGQGEYHLSTHIHTLIAGVIYLQMTLRHFPPGYASLSRPYLHSPSPVPLFSLHYLPVSVLAVSMTEITSLPAN